MEKEYRYLSGRAVKHEMITKFTSFCGLVPFPVSAWMGTGSQEEYETLERLPICKNCERSGS